jgi:hypothetical protein
MKQSVALSEINFGQPEAEHDHTAIRRAFYETESWKTTASPQGMPFVVGRKGAGKSAIAARLEILSRERATCCFIRIVPANFRHVEIRDLLGCLVSKSASWQYIYRKVWEGIILGQIARHCLTCIHTHNKARFSSELCFELERFERECAFYIAELGDSLSDVITNYVRGISKKTDALSQVELRRMLEPYSWTPLIQEIQREFTFITGGGTGLFIVIDGLDEHWDSSAASLYFLAELLAVTKDFTAKFGNSIRFLVCLRDSIFRALVDTKSVEYDKLESLVTNLEWNSRSLFELIARRVSPEKRLENALLDLRTLLPETVEDISTEEYLARHILQRPRDYVNFFRMLQKECGSGARAGEGHVQDTVAKYCANRLVDLENEFGFTYPGISKCIAHLDALSDTFPKGELLEKLSQLCLTPSFRAEAPELIANYGQPLVLARILISIGVVGTYDANAHALRFVHEFSESRVTALWESATVIGIHPVYCHKRRKKGSSALNGGNNTPPAILTHPADFLAEKDVLHADLEHYQVRSTRQRDDLVAALNAIDKGQAHYRRFEIWVKDCMALCFIGDLLNAEEQISNNDRTKKFELIFDIIGSEPPWSEVKGKFKTHRLLIECKNTDEPTDSDFNKLVRDMHALDVNVAFLAYRGGRREPHGNTLPYLRSAYINSNREKVIVTLSDAFLIQCLHKKTVSKCRNNLNALWRDHIQRWLTT